MGHRSTILFITASLIAAIAVGGDTARVPAETSMTAPHHQTISVEMIGPVTQTTDLQIICVLKHNPAGDKYLEAMDDFNRKLHGLISQLRDRGEFAGDAGETFLFTPTDNTVRPRQVLLIGVGAETKLTLDTLKIAGAIAAREAIRLKAHHVSFAPTLRDQGSTRIAVGAGDAATVAGWLLAYDTEKKLQEQGLSPREDVSDFVIEAGPKYFDDTVANIAEVVKNATASINRRESKPYVAQ